MSKSLSSLFYSGKLLPVEPGQVITISGKTRDGAEYFDFFLGSDNGANDDFGDIQFHATVMFTGLVPGIVRRSYTKHVGWAENEDPMHNDPPNPIKRGGDFKISLNVDNDKFLMTIDDEPFCTYPFRKPLVDIKRLNIYGDIEQIYQVNQYVAQGEIPKQRRASFGSIPTINVETAIVFNGKASGSDGGKFEVELINEASRQVLLQLLVNFKAGGITAKSAGSDSG